MDSWNDFAGAEIFEDLHEHCFRIDVFKKSMTPCLATVCKEIVVPTEYSVRKTPRGYLTGVLTAIAAGYKQAHINELLPWNYTSTL